MVITLPVELQKQDLSSLPMRMTGRTPEMLSRLSGTMTVSPAVTGWGWITPDTDRDWGLASANTEPARPKGEESHASGERGILVEED